MNIDIVKENMGEVAWVVEIKANGNDFDVEQAQVIEVTYRLDNFDYVVVKTLPASVNGERELRVRSAQIFATKTAAVEALEERVLERNQALLDKVAAIKAG